MHLIKMIYVCIFAIFFSSLYAEVTPDEALKLLIDGNQRFFNGKSIYPHLDKKTMQDTAKNGQKPFVTILSCSDSRVPPEHIFDAGIGDLFPIRVAGNVSDTDEIGTIEYGVEHLSTPLLVVLGHSSCGAVTAVIKRDAVSGSIPALVDNIFTVRTKADKRYGDSFSPEKLNFAVHENVFQSIEDLLKGSSIIRELVFEKHLKIVGAVYDLETGKVEWLGEHPDMAKLISSEKGENLGVMGLSIFGVLVILFYLILFYFFVSNKRIFRQFKMKARLFIGFITITAGTSLSVFISNILVSKLKIEQNSLMILFYLLPIVIAVCFSIIFTNSVGTTIRDYIVKLKESRNSDQN